MLSGGKHGYLATLQGKERRGDGSFSPLKWPSAPQVSDLFLFLLSDLKWPLGYQSIMHQKWRCNGRKINTSREWYNADSIKLYFVCKYCIFCEYVLYIRPKAQGFSILIWSPYLRKVYKDLSGSVLKGSVQRKRWWIEMVANACFVPGPRWSRFYRFFFDVVFVPRRSSNTKRFLEH